VCKSGQAVQSVGLLSKPEANGNANGKEPEVSKSRSLEKTGRVLTVGQVFFPLDEEFALQPGSLTPRQQEHLAHLAIWMPFARAAQMLERLLGVQVSEPTVRRETERAGAL
jgi:hypothetical protein